MSSAHSKESTVMGLQHLYSPLAREDQDKVHRQIRAPGQYQKHREYCGARGQGREQHDAHSGQDTGVWRAILE